VYILHLRAKKSWRPISRGQVWNGVYYKTISSNSHLPARRVLEIFIEPCMENLTVERETHICFHDEFRVTCNEISSVTKSSNIIPGIKITSIDLTERSTVTWCVSAVKKISLELLQCRPELCSQLYANSHNKEKIHYILRKRHDTTRHELCCQQWLQNPYGCQIIFIEGTKVSVLVWKWFF
jgi:hypothetical protein